VPERVALVAYFVVCEALTNVVRYARAGMAQVRIAVDAGVLCVEVGDDGVGGADPATETACAGWPQPGARSSAAASRSRARQAREPHHSADFRSPLDKRWVTRRAKRALRTCRNRGVCSSPPVGPDGPASSRPWTPIWLP